jgi:hypothetical protein
MVMAALCAACSASDPAPVPLEDFIARDLQARCEFQVKCGGAADMDACAAHLTSGSLSATELAGLQAGRIQYDGKQARACFDAIAARSCEVSTASYELSPAACLKMFHGSLHGGASCADSMECISQNCVKPSCQEACCTGTCQGDAPPALANIGESCAFNECAQGGFCDSTQTCAPAKRSGEACDPDAVLPCGEGLSCLLSSKQCGRRPGLGEPCNDDGCRDLYAHCSPTTGTCVMEGVLGDPCTLGAVDQCTRLYVCGPDHRCSAGLALGAPCGKFDRCAGPGAFCDIADNATMGVCTGPKANSGSCHQDFDCASNVCDPASKTCVADVPCD